MKTITIAGPKGGCGKSSTALNLAVRASQEASKVCMLDLNADQGTLGEWWTLRGRPANPYLYDGDGTLDAVVAALADDGWNYCFIDGPPYEQDLIEMSVLVSDAVLIPVKPAYFDTSAIDSIVGMCQRRKKPYAFLISEWDDRKAFLNSNNLALAMLEGRGQILGQKVSYHPKYRESQIKGKSGGELDKGLAAEIDALWLEVKALAGVQATKAGGRRG